MYPLAGQRAARQRLIGVDFPEREHPAHAIALEHKQAVRTRFCELAEARGAREPALLADQLFLLMDGAFMAARMFGTDSPARGAGDGGSDRRRNCLAHLRPGIVNNPTRQVMHSNITVLRVSSWPASSSNRLAAT